MTNTMMGERENIPNIHNVSRAAVSGTVNPSSISLLLATIACEIEGSMHCPRPHVLRNERRQSGGAIAFEDFRCLTMITEKGHILTSLGERVARLWFTPYCRPGQFELAEQRQPAGSCAVRH